MCCETIIDWFIYLANSYAHVMIVTFICCSQVPRPALSKALWSIRQPLPSKGSSCGIVLLWGDCSLQLSAAAWDEFTWLGSIARGSLSLRRVRFGLFSPLCSFEPGEGFSSSVEGWKSSGRVGGEDPLWWLCWSPLIFLIYLQSEFTSERSGCLLGGGVAEM